MNDETRRQRIRADKAETEISETRYAPHLPVVCKGDYTLWQPTQNL